MESTSGPTNVIRWLCWFAGITISTASRPRYGRRIVFITTTGRSTLTPARIEWAQELPHGFTLTPSLRYTTQSAAFFYFDPVYDATSGPPFPPGYFAESQRLLQR